MTTDFSFAALLVAVGATGTAAGLAFFFIGRWVERRIAARAKATAEALANRILEDARRDAEAFRTSLVVSGKEELAKAREAWEAEVGRRREEIDRIEHRLEEREDILEKKLQVLERRDRELETRHADVDAAEKRAAAHEAEAQGLVAERRRRLEGVAGLSAADAKKELVRSIEEEAKADAAALVRNAREQARREAEKEAKKIVALAIQRIAADHTAETTVAAVALPNDEMKGRIIGREGRNIRAFETATGVDVVIDDTPDTVIVSCFDPVRREVARLSLERLIADGRIHPGRIEDVVKNAQADVDRQIQEAGEQAAYEVGVHGLHPEIVKLVGRMRFRTSYGQNMLKHSKEVAWLAGIMAAELKLDIPLAKRGALLHDIGKVLTHESEGTHVQLGVEVATKYGEPAVVINCIAAHHDDVPHESPISVIVQAADAVSGSRPGARREAFESYVKRLTKLEEIASGFDGVEKVYAIQAGREIRVMVTPDRIDDGRASSLAEEMARKIENELQYPGQIRVVVIRETRAVDFAK
ncbi:MAG TPA: ribonuclease Y [Gemmatimonadales bacterium]|nr:ribonuclease Y [Gemmatimonadales bacterium]